MMLALVHYSPATHGAMRIASSSKCETFPRAFFSVYPIMVLFYHAFSKLRQ